MGKGQIDLHAYIEETYNAVDEDKIKFLLDMSYELTKGGRR